MSVKAVAYVDGKQKVTSKCKTVAPLFFSIQYVPILQKRCVSNAGVFLNKGLVYCPSDFKGVDCRHRKYKMSKDQCE